jgi:glutathione S-transferase
VDGYFDKALDPVVDYAFAKDPASRDEKKFAEGKAALAEEFALFERALAGDYLVGPLSAADFALYPLVAFLDRCRVKLPDFDVGTMLPAGLAGWKRRIEALPYFAATYPPHWQAKA